MTRHLREVLGQGVRALNEAGVDGALRDARLLLADALGLEVARLTLEPDLPVSAGEQARFQAAIAARCAGKPVSRILGRRAFWGRDFAVTPEVLDPRPETETLIAAALEIGAPARFADLGTGSGIIAVSLLGEWPKARAVATDIDPACLAVARENAARHGVESRLTTLRANWFAGLTGRFEMILSNPPYIAAEEMAALAPEVREHDPHIALSPGGDGLEAYRAICAGVALHLAPGGHLLVEIGPTQGAAVRALFEAAGLQNTRVLADLDRRDRVVLGQNPGP